MGDDNSLTAEDQRTIGIHAGDAMRAWAESLGSYGMVIGKSGGEAPSPDERAVRGLGPNPPTVDKQ